jgi:maltooligosyltrehalose trehalohydrolase
MLQLVADRSIRAAGADVTKNGVHFRVWAPRHRTVEVVLREKNGSPRIVPLREEGHGHYAVLVEDAGPGTRYAFRIPGGERDYPDPASRYQPEGVHEPSEVIDPSTFRWTDRGWKGVKLPGQVIYELHIGTFTPEGTFAAAQEKLSFLAGLGVTIIEIMPVAEFTGEFGWGYDGVYWFAPTRLYGRPDDFRAFVDAAHSLGLGVILDVVYNHFGPTGNYTGVFSDDYLLEEKHTDWGGAINYDGPNANVVRDFVTSNAAYWIREFHLDGLRLDATHALFDESPRHILADLSVAARAAAGDRSIILVAENETQHARHVFPLDEGGFGFDGLWNDDFHHACRVAATGHAEYSYSDYAGTPQELISATRWGYLYQGQWNRRQNDFRGTPAWHLPAHRFVHCLQNHDQVANSAQGLRGHRLTSPGRHRALTTLLMLGPATPMLFMGQEFMASAPFLYFADQEVDIAALVRDGRREFLRQFARVAGIMDENLLSDPSDPSTFERSKIDWNECDRNSAALDLHRDLIRLRKEDSTFARQDAKNLHGAVIGPEAFLLRWLYNTPDDRLLLVNLGRDFRWFPAAEPLLAPPVGMNWKLLWSSDEPKYGGSGTALLNTRQWQIPGHAAIVLTTTEFAPGLT